MKLRPVSSDISLVVYVSWNESETWIHILQRKFSFSFGIRQNSSIGRANLGCSVRTINGAPRKQSRDMQWSTLLTLNSQPHFFNRLVTQTTPQKVLWESSCACIPRRAVARKRKRGPRAPANSVKIHRSPVAKRVGQSVSRSWCSGMVH